MVTAGIMQKISDIQIFDHNLLKQKRQRSAANFVQYDFLFSWAEDQLLDRLSLVNKDFENVLIIGDRITSKLAQGLKAQQITHMNFANTHQKTDGQTICASPEFIPFADESFDLIISNLDLHSVNDLPGCLLQLKKALKPDGLVLASIFGGETLQQLRQSLMQTEMSLKGGVSPRVFPFADKQDMGALLQRAGYALPVVDSDILTVTYDTMFKLMVDIRGMGESNIIIERDKTNPGKEFFMKAAQYYHENYAEEDGRIPATFEIIFLHGWAPHESQQKPLQPGSAQNRLAEALGSKEQGTGEKPLS